MRWQASPNDPSDGGNQTHFPQSLDSISRHSGLRLEAEGGDGEAHEGEDLLMQLAELRFEHLNEVAALS